PTATAATHALSLHDALPISTLPEPLALLEVGASAGLCLRYDAYRYRYRADTGAAEVTVGDGDVVLDCTVTDVPLPDRVPVLAARDRKSTRLNSSHVKISYAV